MPVLNPPFQINRPQLLNNIVSPSPTRPNLNARNILLNSPINLFSALNINNSQLDTDGTILFNPNMLQNSTDITLDQVN